MLVELVYAIKKSNFCTFICLAGSDYNNYDHQNRTCETIIEVAVNDNGRVGWKCKGSVKYPELTPYIRNCDYASDCNSFFRYQQQVRHTIALLLPISPLFAIYVG